MSGPIPLIFILVTYIYSIKKWLPEVMENRQSYDLKNVINVYNVFQVIANSILFYGVSCPSKSKIHAKNRYKQILTSGWTTTLHLGCALPDYSDDPEAVRMATWMWRTAMLKIVELIETVFFILRKKNNQASFLHIYHHIITVSVIWVGVKYSAGEIHIDYFREFVVILGISRRNGEPYSVAQFVRPRHNVLVLSTRIPGRIRT
jgi:elongation of very long chain fatty acids protein 7